MSNIIATVRNKQTGGYYTFYGHEQDIALSKAIKAFDLNDKLEFSYTYTKYTVDGGGNVFLSLSYSSGGESMREYLETQKRYNNIIL